MQLIFFHANYCPPCKQMQPIAEQYAAQNGMPLYTFRSDDVHGGNEMARQHHVKRLPCLGPKPCTHRKRCTQRLTHT